MRLLILIKLISYVLITKNSNKETLVKFAIYISYLFLLLLFSSVFNDAYFLLNKDVNFIYYQRQSEHIIWLFLSASIIVKSHHISKPFEEFVKVIMNKRYIYAKIIVYAIQVFFDAVLLYGFYQLVGFFVFDQILSLESFWIIYINALTLSSFMILFIRIQNKYTLILSMILALLLPMVDIMPPGRYLLPYSTALNWHLFSIHVSMSLLYILFGLKLYHMKTI